MNKNSNTIKPSDNKHLLLLWLVASAFLIQIFLSWPLWFANSDRSLPKVGLPLFAGLADILFFIMLGGLAGVFFIKKKLYPIGVIVGCFLALVAEDVLRLQPWAYQYCFIFLLMGAYYSKPQKFDATAQLGYGMIWIGTYFWSGFHKFNAHFQEEVYVWLMEIFEWSTPLAAWAWGGYFLALVEMGLAFGLLFAVSRKWALCAITAFHGGILFFLIGDYWNVVVYPWNVAMVIGAWIIFGGADWEISLLWKRAQSKLLVALIGFFFWLAPGLYVVNAWPYNLSLTMYSALSLDGQLIFKTQEGMACLAPKVHKEVQKTKQGYYMLDFDDWVTLETSAPAWSTDWYLRKVSEGVCDCLIEKGEQAMIRTTLPERYRDTIYVDAYLLPCLE